MKLILREDVHNLGKSGALVTVKDGFGRNFLLPRKMAGDVDERPGVPERDGFRPEGADPEPRPEFEEEMPEEG